MQIRCPECKLERDIDPSGIPATAVMATCPQCKARFRFRTLESSAAPAPVAPAAPGPGAPAAPVAPVAPSATPVAPGPGSPAAPVAPVAPGVQETPDSAKASDASDDLGPMATPVRLGSADDADSDGSAKGAAEQPVSPLLKDNTKAGASLQGEGEAAKHEDVWLDVPWERPDRYGHAMGLYHTIVRVMFSAPRFFSALPRCGGSIMRPLLFYVLLGLFQTVVKLMWFQSMAPSVTDPHVQELLSSTDMSLAMTLLVAPGILAAQLFLYAALFFLMLRLVQPEQVVFPTVLRVVAYSSAPMVVCAVPVIGPMVGLVWFAASCFVGCRYALSLPWHKVALALVPLYLIGFAITMQFVQHLLQQG